VELEPGTVREVYVEQVEFPLLLCKQVFKNEDGSEGVLYLLSSDVTLDYEQFGDNAQKLSHSSDTA
jgi:hypothetical protein